MQRIPRLVQGRPFALSLSCLLLLASLATGAYVYHAQRQMLQRAVDQRGQFARNSIIAQVESQFRSIERLARRSGAQQAIPEELWRQDAQALLDDYSGIDSLGWLEPDYRVRWAQPIANQPENRELAVTRNPELAAKLEAAVTRSELEMWGPTTLVNGDTAIYVFVPVFTANNPTGFIVARLRFRPLLDEILTAVLANGFNLAIYVGEEQVYYRGEPIPPELPESSFYIDIDGDHSDWRFVLTPRLIVVNQVLGPMPMLIWVGGGGLSLLLLIALWARGAVRKKTNELAVQTEEREQVEAELAHISIHDPLTGLPNRLQLERELQLRILNEQKLVILVIDLDHFKDVNDSLDHHLGDQILRQVGKRLSALAGNRDFVARMGGDEFVLCRSSSTLQVFTGTLLSALREPYRLNEQEFHLSASIGIAHFPEDGRNVRDLLAHADAALHSAKAAGRDRVQRYEEGMSAAAGERIALLRELRQALDQDRFEMWFQPRCTLPSGRPAGAEALIRWRREDGSIENPAAFLPLLEDSGLIETVGLQTMERAMRDFCALTGVSSSLVLSVNLSARQLEQTGIVEQVRRLLAQTGLAPERLELELTEEALVHDLLHSRSVLATLHDTGVRIAVDDFGTGYSSLSYLKSFPLDVIKIDRSFVAGLPGDPDDLVIVRTILAMGRSLGKVLVAEGVETEDQFQLLANEGCDEAQGYYLSEPLPLEQFRSWLNALELTA